MPAREVVHNLTDWVVTVPIPVMPDINLTLAERYPHLDVDDKELTEVVREQTQYESMAKLADVAEIVAQQTRACQSIILL